jgi:hypothetical protein
MRKQVRAAKTALLVRPAQEPSSSPGRNYQAASQSPLLFLFLLLRWRWQQRVFVLRGWTFVSIFFFFFFCFDDEAKNT